MASWRRCAGGNEEKEEKGKAAAADDDDVVVAEAVKEDGRGRVVFFASFRAVEGTEVDEEDPRLIVADDDDDDFEVETEVGFISRLCNGSKKLSPKSISTTRNRFNGAPCAASDFFATASSFGYSRSTKSKFSGFRSVCTM